MRALGKDASIVVQRDDVVLVTWRRVRDWTYTPGLEELIDNYQGELNDDIAGTNSHERFEFNTVPSDSEYLKILEIQRLKNDGDPNYIETSINVTFLVDHGNGDVGKRLLPDCTLVGGAITSSGRTEYITQAPALICSRGRNLGASAL